MRTIVENMISKDYEVITTAFDREDLISAELNADLFEEYLDSDYGTVFYKTGLYEENDIFCMKVVNVMRELLSNEFDYEELFSVSDEEIDSIVNSNYTKYFFQFQ